MARQTIRPYEMSVWGLQDDFIITLSAPNITHKGQIIDPVLTNKDDGTQELSFSIPMYYFHNNEIMENTLWYNTTNGVLLVGQRKIKVIFNKGNNDEKVFEFVISKITETHQDDGQLICEVEAEGLAFQELGKTGYKLSLTQDNFELEYEEWFNKPENERGEEPIASLNYWADKIFEGTKWTYEVQMNWSAYDGVASIEDNSARENAGLRRTDKVYEEDYVSSWEVKNGKLIPSKMISFREKARMVSIEKSNRYNATQDLAEAFEVFCRYEYEYDSNYHIIGRKCIFYNTFLQEDGEHIDLQYAMNSKEISREMDSSEITTKMYVVPLEDDTTDSGLLTIADASANKTGEDYILNFDYMYSIGAITQEQYDEIQAYERQMFILNSKLTPLAKKIAEETEKANEISAQRSILVTSQSEALEQMNNAQKMLDALLGEDGILERGVGKPDLVVYLKDDGANTYHINISQEGVISNTLKLFNAYSNGALSEEAILTEANKKYDENTGVLIGLQNLIAPTNGSNRGYLTYSYSPDLHYKQIYQAYATRLANDQEKDKELEEQYNNLQELIKKNQEIYDVTLAQKKKDVSEFERFMGSALKEGSWQAESYTDYGNYYNVKLQVGGMNAQAKDLAFVWDKEPFDGEQLGYYKETINEIKVNYFCIDLTSVLPKIKDHIDDLRFFCKKTQGDPAEDISKIYSIGSEMVYGFYQNSTGKITPVLLILDKTAQLADLKKAPSKLGYVTAELNSEGIATVVQHELTDTVEWFEDFTQDFVYPRILIGSSLAKTSYEDLGLKYNDEELQKYYDYSVLYRDYLSYITLDNNFVVSHGTLVKELEITYILSNGALSLYLDALEVSKTNAQPKVSYDVSISYMNKNIIAKLYKCLGVMVNVNDFELKFNNVEGYISELELHLESPWEDKVTVKNYKTKFEDLFGRIVASSEEMKTNSYLYNTAASAFNTNGSLKIENIQSTLSQADLTYAFMDGTLTIDEENGIWGTSDRGVVAYRGGGIFTATQKDGYGNWIWNTGITPEGINASLLRAGQIDTNAIRIFAGDNVAFQMNRDGLFAYRFDSKTGEPSEKEYVVHNGEGLFLVNKKGLLYTENGVEKTLTQDVNRVEISWYGLILRNLKNEAVFQADQAGNLTLTGKIEAKTGSIGGWDITDNGLVSRNKTGSAGLYSSPLTKEDGSIINDRVFWVGQDTDDSSQPSFYVERDGTFYANNAILKGSISANSIIGGTGGSTILDAIKKIEVVNLSGGQTFNYYNDNLDGNITVLPDILRFRIMTNSLSQEEMLREGATTREWAFYYANSAGDWIEIDLEANKDFIEFLPSYLTFTVNNKIMSLGETNALVEAKDFKVVLKGRTQYLVDGYPAKTADGKDLVDKDYEAIFTLRNRDYGINKFLSLIDPQSYTFVEDMNNGISYASSASFSVILKNIDIAEGTWVIDGTEIQGETVVSGNSGEGESTTKGGSTMIVPEINMNDGIWYIDDVEVKNGDTITDNGGSTSGSIIITTEAQPDGSIKSTITVPHTRVPEGGQITLRFQLNKASRTAFLFKNKNGADSISVVLRSSTGTAFINGEGSAELSAELYFGAQRMNDDTSTSNYYYVWKKDGVALSTINVGTKDADTGSTIITTYSRIKVHEAIFNYPKIVVSPDNFEKKADYSCYIFSSSDEAIDEYLKNNEEGLETKDNF